jgi:hypothetical protein
VANLAATFQRKGKPMSDTVKTWNLKLELDQALRFAVILAWEDLMKPTEPRSVRVEYLFEPGTALDHLSVWSTGAAGYQDLVCDYWTWASLAHPSGARFGSTHYSDKLAQTLVFVMKHQGQFTHPADAGRDGLVQIHPPGAEDRIEAATWMRLAQGMESEEGAREAPDPPDDLRRDEEARSRMDAEGYPNEAAATLPETVGHSGVGGRLLLVGSPIF